MTQLPLRRRASKARSCRCALVAPPFAKQAADRIATSDCRPRSAMRTVVDQMVGELFATNLWTKRQILQGDASEWWTRWRTSIEYLVTNLTNTLI